MFARKISVIGFDINAGRIEMMRNRQDPSRELPPEAFDGCDIEFTADVEKLREAQFFVVAVPTPIDKHNNPDLTPVIRASETVAKVLKKGDYVVYESTVYPGCTEEDCVPILERSKLKYITDFKVGYSPERINPGDPVHTVSNTVKVVSGCDALSADEIEKVYSLVIEAGLHKASSIKVAEAAKIIENTQRDLNIALMNELSLIFNKMGINTYEVIEAASTKWNFVAYKPGLVGGHCIGVDPYYLTYKASEIGYHPKLILAGRQTNDSMGFYVGEQVVKKMIAIGKNIRDTKVLIMGATFKEDVSDIRNSKVADVVKELQSYKIAIDVTDPHADSTELLHEYGFGLCEKIGTDYDAIIIAVAHKEYRQLDEAWFLAHTNAGGAVIADLKSLYRGNIRQLTYWSL
jgi:UDP-N-acetyl-D-galactosamine dehydrogenase